MMNASLQSRALADSVVRSIVRRAARGIIWAALPRPASFPLTHDHLQLHSHQIKAAKKNLYRTLTIVCKPGLPPCMGLREVWAGDRRPFIARAFADRADEYDTLTR